jgi:DNA methylase
MKQLSLFKEPTVSASSDDFLREIAEFREFGRKSERHKSEGIDYFVNEFWTAAQRKAHSIHEISYRACFKAQLPEFFIARLTRSGDTVFDPFMGRGTTPIQAALMQRKAYGNDVNPLSILLTRPRLNHIDFQEVTSALESVDWSNGAINREDLLAFYHPKTLIKLEALKNWLQDQAPLGSEKIDRVADWIRMVAINRLSGHSPGFFSGRSMPPNQAVSVKSQLKINQKLGMEPPERNIIDLINKKTKALLKDGAISSAFESSLHVGPAWNVHGIPDGSIDLVVTSPPFLDIVQYAADNWLRCWFAGIDSEKVKIDTLCNEDQWTNMIHRVLSELTRVVRPDGYIAIEVGEVRNGKILLERLVWLAAEGLPLERLCVIVNAQQFTKTANCWGVSNGIQGTNTNRIVILRRS